MAETSATARRGLHRAIASQRAWPYIGRMVESSAARGPRIRKAAGASDGPPQGSVCGSGGLIRGRVGPGATLADAFAVLEADSSDVAVMRHPVRNLQGARIGLDPADGCGYYDLTRIGSDVFVIVGN